MLFACAAEPVPVKAWVVPPWSLFSRTPSLKNNFDLSNINKVFKKKNSFKGKIGIFDIKNNEINHRLNFYKIENKELIKIF